MCIWREKVIPPPHFTFLITKPFIKQIGTIIPIVQKRKMRNKSSKVTCQMGLKTHHTTRSKTQVS